MIAVLVGAWALLQGRIGPRRSASARRALLHAGPIGPRTWIRALSAGVPAMATMFFLDSHACMVLPVVWNGLPVIGEVARLPLAVGIPFGLVSCAVAAVAEEAAFRGYMQSDLETRFGRLFSWLAVAVAFAGFHLVGRSFADWRAGLLNWIAISLVFSALTDWSGSLLPAIVCHFVVDAALLSLDWLDPKYDPFRRMRLGPIPAGCLLAAVAAVVSIAAFAKLRQLDGGSSSIA
jgi:membrane protease YdiL (CAAX protease family)